MFNETLAPKHKRNGRGLLVTVAAAQHGRVRLVANPKAEGRCMGPQCLIHCREIGGVMFLC